jgi:hypothetical protein
MMRRKRKVQTMNIPALIFLASETVKIVLSHLAERGQLNNLTQVQAEAMVKSIADNLPSVLPTPEELEALPEAPPITQ